MTKSETDTKDGLAHLNALAQQHGFSMPAVLVMRDALVRGDGRLAQFSHPEFGGSGQWMQGGMIMLGDMFNNVLKSRVDALCTELAALLASHPAAAAEQDGARQAGAWWPAGLFNPTIAGAQNGVRFAYFNQPRRLVIDDNGHMVVYDTQDHLISGVSQQQSRTASVTFTSQHGVIDVAQLPVV